MSKSLLQALKESLDSCKLLEIVDNSYSSSNVLRELGFCVKGNYCSIVKDFLIQNDVDISHFKLGKVGKPDVTKTCPVCSTSFTQRGYERSKVTCSYACSNTYFRSGKDNPNWKGGKQYRALAFSHYKPICSKCGYSDNILAIDVHHKDRNRSNNSLNNLEVLCCNCHAIEHRTSNEWVYEEDFDPALQAAIVGGGTL